MVTTLNWNNPDNMRIRNTDWTLVGQTIQYQQVLNVGGVPYYGTPFNVFYDGPANIACAGSTIIDSIAPIVTYLGELADFTLSYIDD